MSSARRASCCPCHDTNLSRCCALSRVTIVARRSTSVHPSRICQLRGTRERERERDPRGGVVRSIARDAIPAVAVVVARVVTVVTVVVGVTLKICGSEKRTAEHTRLVAERSAACSRLRVSPLVPDEGERGSGRWRKRCQEDPARRRPRG